MSIVITNLIVGLIGAYIAYKVEKIDKRQDVIEVDIAVIKSCLPKRIGEKFHGDK